MKKFGKHWRKPLSLLLALCIFMSAASVGLTVFAADLAENRSAKGKTLDSLDDLGFNGTQASPKAGEEQKTELEKVTEYVNRYKANKNDAEAENWLWDKLVENLKKGYNSGIFKVGDTGLSATDSLGGVNHTSIIYDDVEGTSYNTLMVYWALVSAKMVASGPRSDDWNWLGGEYKNMTNTLQSKMGGDFEAHKVGDTIRWLSAIYNKDHKCNNESSFVVSTIAPAKKTYLTRYASVDKLPNSVPTQFATVVSHYAYKNFIIKSDWGFDARWFGGNNVEIASADSYCKNRIRIDAPDTTSKKTLTDFQNTYTSEVMNIENINDIGSYTAEQFAAIFDSKAVIDDISTMDVSIGEHFFTRDTDVYEGDPFARANEIYNAVVALTQSAYDNFQAKVGELDATYGTKVLTFDDFAPFKQGLDNAIAFYNVIDPNKVNDQVILDAKLKYDALLDKYNTEKVAVYQSVADGKIAELYNALQQTATVDGKTFKISEFVKSNSTTVDFDSGKGFIKPAADLYHTLAKIAIGGQFLTNPTKAEVMNWVTDQITKTAGYDPAVYNSYEMGNVLVAFSQQNSSSDFSLSTKPLLYTYNNIGEIADNAIFLKTTYTFLLDGNGKIISDEGITQKTIQVPDRKAKPDFTLWARAFDAVTVAQDLSKLDATTLKSSMDKAVAAISAVEPYDSYVKGHLLGNFGYTLEQGKQRLADILQAIPDNFIARATSFNAEYADMSTVVGDAAYYDFFEKYDDIAALYNLIENKTPEMEALKTEADRLNGIACMKMYLDDAEKAKAFYKPGTVEFAPFTSRTITLANDLLKAMKKHYKGMLTADLSNPLVVAAKEVEKALEAAINAYFNGTVRPWEQTSMDYSKTPNASPESLRGIVGNIDSLFGTDILNSILGPALQMDLPEGKPLNEALFDQIIKLICANADTIANAIVKMIGPAIYTKIQEMGYGDIPASFAADAGLCGYPNRANNYLKDYPNVYNELTRAGGSWKDVNWDKMVWTDKNGKALIDYANEGKGVEAFVQLMGSALAPFWGVIKALLYNESTSVSVIGIQVKALDGYPGLLNQVFPMFKQLGIGNNPNNPNQAWDKIYCRAFTIPQGNSFGASTNSAQDIVNLARDTWQVMGKLLIPVFDWLKNEVLANPIDSITNLLPKLSEMMASNRIVEGLNKMTKPVGDVLGDLLNSIDLTSVNGLLEMVFPDKKIILPDGSTIRLPDLDQGFLAGLAKQQTKTTVGNVDITNGYSKAFNGGTDMVAGIALDTSETYDQVLYYLLDYVIGTVKNNEGVISRLLGDKETAITKYLKSALSKDDDTILNSLIGVLMNRADIENDDWDMASWKFDQATVDYGDVSNAQARKALENIDKLINSVAEIALSTDLKSLVGKSIYTDATMNSILGLFKTIGTDQIMPILEMLGIDISVAKVAENLAAYPAVSNYLKEEIEVTDSKGNVTRRLRTWAEVDLKDVSWGFGETTASADFATAISKVFKPFNGILQTLLAGKDFPILGGVLTIKGANGYANSVLPLLNGILGCDALSPDAFKTEVEKDPDMMLASIIKPVLDKVDKILDAPVGTLADVLPNLAYFVDNGGLTKILNNLLKPVTQLTDEIMPLLEKDGKTPNIFEVIETILLDNPAMSPDIAKFLDMIDFSDQAFLDKAIVPVLTDVLANLTIGGQTMSINLPNIDWGKLAGMGTQTSDTGFFQRIVGNGTNHIEADRGAAGFTLMSYVFKAVAANKDMILGMLSGVDLGTLTPIVSQFLTNILSNDPAKMTSALIKALSVDNPADENWDLGEFTYTVTDKLYKDEDEQRAKEAVAKTDILLAGVLKMAVPDAGSIEELVKGYISDATIRALFQPIYTALDDKKLKDILAKLGLKTAPKDLAIALKDLGNVSTILEKYDTWVDVFADPDWQTASFGVDANNVEETFALALSKMFAPFEGILQALLVKKDFAITGADGYEIKGANGYNNSILPILGALGATSEDGILTSEEMLEIFKTGTTDPDAEKGVLYSIVKPVLNTVFRATQSPVTFLANMLPNFALFMEKGALTDSVMNLLKPITQISDIIVGLDQNFDSTFDFVLYLLGELKVTLPAGLDLENIEGSILDVVNGFLANGIKVGEKDSGVGDGSKTDIMLKIQLPEFEWKTLAGRGELAKDSDITFMMNSGKGGNKQYVKANGADAYMAVLNYLTLTVTSNKTEILALISDLAPTLSPEIVDIIKTLLNNDSKVLAEAIMHVISTNEITDDDWDMETFVHDLTQKVYAGESDRIDGAITNTDKIIGAVLSNVAGIEGGLAGLLTGNFSDANAKELFKLVFTALDTPDITSVMSTLKFDLSPKAMETAFAKAGFDNIANYIKTAIGEGDTTWAAIFARADWETATFDVTDAYTFAKAISAMFVPFDGVIKALAVKDSKYDYQALDLYTIKSANGYKTAILPILGALGCTEADGVKTADEFAADLESNPDQGALFNIIRPVLKMAERASANPVDFLTGMLPNFAFFMNNKGLTRSLTNLIKPITNITDELIPLFNLPANSTSIDLVKYFLGIFLPENSSINDILGQIDFENLEISIMDFAYKFLKDGIAIDETTKISIDLPKIDWGILAGRGELKTDSNAPFFAKVTGDKTYKYVEADKSEVFMAVLTYIANVVKTNETTIMNLLKGFLETSLGAETYAKLEVLITAIVKAPAKELAEAIMHVLNTAPVNPDDWDMETFIFETTDKIYGGEEQRIETAISKMDTMISVALSKFAGMENGLTGLLTGNYSDTNANALFTALYKALGGAELAQTLGTLGFDISPAAMQKAFEKAGLTSVSEFLATTIQVNPSYSWTEIFALTEWANVSFGVTSRETFARAISVMFLPFAGVLNAVLMSDNDFAIMGAYEVRSSNGYGEAVLPILGAIGATANDGILSAEEFKTAYEAEPEIGVLYNIINPVLKMAERAAANPVDFFTSMLPNFAYFMNNDGFTRSVNNLIKPITNISDEIMPLFKDLFEGETPTLPEFIVKVLGIFMPDFTLPAGLNLKDLEASVLPIINGFLNNLEINGKQVSLQIPDIDWKTLSGRGEIKKDGKAPFLNGSVTDGKFKYVQSNKAEVLMAVLTFVADTVKVNWTEIDKLLADLLGDTYTTIKPIIETVLSSESKDIADTIMHVISTKPITDNDWSLLATLTEAYQQLYTGDEELRARLAVTKIDNMLKKALEKFVPSLVGGLPGALNGALNDANAKMVMELVYKALGTADVAGIMNTIGLDISASAVKSAFEAAGLGNVATVIENAIAANVDVTMGEVIASEEWKTVTLGVTDSDTFAKALSTMFVPFDSVIKALLIKDKDFDIAGIYGIKSSNGYLEAVLPILGALGCTTEDGVLSAEDFAKADTTNGVLYNIIKPVLNMAARATENPVAFLTKMLPNFAFFMENKGLTNSLTSLLKPITNITDELIPVFGLEEGATSVDLVKYFIGIFVPADDPVNEILAKIDFEDLEGSLMNFVYKFLEDGIAIDETTTISIDLPTIDWEQLANRGVLKKDGTSPFMAGTGGKYKYIEADQEEVLMAVLTYVAQTVLDNEVQIIGLLKTLLGDTYTTLEPIITALLNNDAKTIADAIMHVISTKNITDFDWSAEELLQEALTAIYTGDEETRVKEAISKIDTMLEKAIAKFVPALAGGIPGALTGAMNNANVKAVFDLVYNALGSSETAGLMKTLELDVSATAVKSAFETAGLGNVATIIGEAITANSNVSMTEIITSEAWKNADFGVTGADTFAKALSTMFVPFNDLLKALLIKGDDYAVAGIYEVKSSDGYGEAILPILGALGCADALSVDEFKNADNNTYGVLYNIINPVLKMAVKATEHPVDFLTKMLPNLAFFIDNKGLTTSLKNLLKPITNITDELVPLFGLEEGATSFDLVKTLLGMFIKDDAIMSIVDGIDFENVEESIMKFAYDFLEGGIAIDETTTLDLVIPRIDWSKLAGRGELKTNADAPFLAKVTGNKTYKYVEADQEEVLMAVLTYVADVVLANSDQIKGLLKGLLGDTYGTLETLIDAIFKSNSKDIADAIMHIIATKPIEDDEWNLDEFIHDVSDIIYDSGEADRVNGAIVKLEAMIDVALKKFANLEGGINGILTGALNSDTVNTLFSAVYSALGTAELAGTMGTLGIDVSASAVKTAFENAGLGNIATIIQNAINENADVTMAEIIASPAWVNADFGVTGSETFAQALSTMFVPFDGVLGALLAGKTFEVAGVYEIKGARGYKNSVLPILGALGCTADDGVLTADEFDSADSSKFGVLYNIINPVVKMADRASKAPIDFLTKMLPNFAYFMDTKGLTRAVTNLIKPLTNITDEILPILKDLPGLPENPTSIDLVKAILGLFVTDDAVTSIVNGIDFKDLEGSIMNFVYGFLEGGIVIDETTTLNLEIPRIDWHILAGRGELKTNADAPFLAKVTGNKAYRYVEANQADSFMAVLKYIASVVTTNKGEIQRLIAPLLSGMEEGALKDTVNGMINTALSKNPEDIANAIMHVLNTSDIPDDNWDMTSFIFKLTTGMLGENVTSEEVLDAIGIVDETAGKLISEFLGSDLTTLVKDNIYTDANVSAIFTGLFGALGSAEISNVLSTFGIDVSVAGMKNALSKYPEITAILAKHTSMADVLKDPALETASWKITDKDSFANAIAAVLSPFNSLLKALLIKDSDNDFDVMNMYKIKSSNGYSESVLPLLAALGCTELKSASDYKKAVKADENALVAELIKPVLALVEKIAANPVDTMASILPNIAYFINNDGITRVLTNLIKPLSNVLDEIIPIITSPLATGKYPTSMEYILGLADTFVPEGIAGTKVSEIIGNTKTAIVPLINFILSDVNIMGQKIQIPAIDFGVLAGCGNLVSNADAPFLSKVLGSTKFKYVEADKSQSTMAVLNYLVKTLQLNEDALVSIVSGLIPENPELSSKVADIIKLVLDNEPSSISGALIKVITYKGGEDYQWKEMLWEAAKAIYPSGVTGARVETTAKGIDAVLKNALDVLLNTSLANLLETGLYTNTNISTIVKALYGAVGTEEIQAITSMFGVDTSVGSFADAVAGTYPRIATLLAGKTDWAEVDLTNANWSVSDADSFAKALATVLSPFNKLLKFFLVEGNELVVLDSVTLHSGNGYSNAIVPFLNALGCENIMSGEDYANAVAKDETALLTSIINPVLQLVGKIAKDPVVTLSTILPNFAYFMDNSGITQMVDALILPVTGMFEPIVSLITKDSLINFVVDLLGITLPLDINNLENEIVPLINGIISTMEINGKPLGLEIPEFSWHKLAGFGKLQKDGKVVANIDDVAVSLLNYIASIPSYKNNGSAITTLLGDTATGIVGDILHNVVTADPDDLVSLIVDLFDPTDDGLSGKWSFKSITSKSPSYTPNLSEADFAEGIVTFDAVIPGLISQFAGGTLQDLVGNGVFTNQMVNTIGSAIFGLLGSENIAGILETVADVTGIDLTPSGVAGYLTESRFSNARKVMNSASSWADVDFTKINWGFKDGDQNAFLETVVAMFRPALGVLEVVLNSKDFVLLDGVVIKGADGYNNAIIPLLEALCCDNILTQKQYDAAIQKNQDNVILAILKPIMAKLNDLLVAPMGTLTEVLPNVGYFMYNDGLAQLLDNILLPINKILKSVSPVYELDLDSILGTVKNINVPDAVNDLLAGIEVNGKPLGFKINQFSWENLAACGVASQFTSPQVDANGKAIRATRIDANKPQTFVTVLRYLIATIQDPGNLAAINSLLEGVDLGSLSTVVTGLLSSIGSSDVDSVIEMLFATLLGIGVKEEEDVTGGTTRPSTTQPTTTTKPATTVPAKPGTTTPGNVAPTQPAPTEEGNKVNLPLIIGLVIAGLLLLGLAIWLIIFLRKKKNAQTALGSATATAIDEGNAETASTNAESQETVSNKKE